jgi:hypothetical protein
MGTVTSSDTIDIVDQLERAVACRASSEPSPGLVSVPSTGVIASGWFGETLCHDQTTGFA